MTDFFIQTPETRKPKKSKRSPAEIRKDIETQKTRYQRADRCCNGLAMQQALKRIKELENELAE